jgi:hypothetical protein
MTYYLKRLYNIAAYFFTGDDAIWYRNTGSPFTKNTV